jgi:hypothetical protein
MSTNALGDRLTRKQNRRGKGVRRPLWKRVATTTLAPSFGASASAAAAATGPVRGPVLAGPAVSNAGAEFGLRRPSFWTSSNSRRSRPGSSPSSRPSRPTRSSPAACVPSPVFGASRGVADGLLDRSDSRTFQHPGAAAFPPSAVAAPGGLKTAPTCQKRARELIQRAMEEGRHRPTSAVLAKMAQNLSFMGAIPRTPYGGGYVPCIYA